MAGLSNLWPPLSMMRIAPLYKYMPEIITIDGVIGFDVLAKDVKTQLLKAKGKAISVQVSSPGGDVYEMLSIYNAIKNYKGPSETVITGLAASAASYIALATDKVTAESNAIYMIHNAQGLAIGDHNDLRERADIFERMSNQISKAYVKKTGKTKDEINALMDSTTYFFGSEIQEAGFADAMIESEETEEKEDAFALAQLMIEDCTAKLKELNRPDNLEKIAALLPQKQTTPKGAAKMTPEEIAAMKAENERLTAELEKAKLAEAPKAEAKKEEPKTEAPTGDHVTQALNVLKSDSYSAPVKDSASKVIEASSNKEGTDYIIAVASFQATVSGYDSAMELAKSKEAAAEQAALKDTPATPGEDSGIDAEGKITSEKGIYALAAQIKEEKEGDK